MCGKLRATAKTQYFHGNLASRGENPDEQQKRLLPEGTRSQGYSDTEHRLRISMGGVIRNNLVDTKSEFLCRITVITRARQTT